VIADHRVTRRGELDADLMAPAGSECEVEHGRRGAALAHAVARDGQSGAGFSTAGWAHAQ
jgi:hypothetical protein